MFHWYLSVSDCQPIDVYSTGCIRVSELKPTAVLKAPVVFKNIDLNPIAVFSHYTRLTVQGKSSNCHEAIAGGNCYIKPLSPIAILFCPA